MSEVQSDPSTTGVEQAREASSADVASIAGAVEAVVFSSDRPVSAIRIARALGLAPPQEIEPKVDSQAVPPPTADDAADAGGTPKKTSRRRKNAAGIETRAMNLVDAAIVELNSQYESTGRAFRIECVSGGYRVMTLAVHAGVVAALRGTPEPTRLSRAAVETLAIIAYRQPITRADLEAIRGVACGEVLRSLMDRRLITVAGRAEELGRPLLYGTTKQFLDSFGLASLKDLPTLAELKVGGNA